MKAPLVDIVYNKIRKRFHCNAKHWTLHYLKTTSTNETEIATFLRTNVDTMRLYVVRTMRMLIIILPSVMISFFLLFSFFLKLIFSSRLVQGLANGIVFNLQS
jgi:hypothetical protein